MLNRASPSFYLSGVFALLISGTVVAQSTSDPMELSEEAIKIMESGERASEALLNQYKNDFLDSIEGPNSAAQPVKKMDPKAAQRRKTLYSGDTNAIHYRHLFTGDNATAAADAYLLKNLARSSFSPSLIASLSQSSWEKSQLASVYRELMSENAFIRRKALADFNAHLSEIQANLQNSAASLIGTKVFFWKQRLPVASFNFDNMSKNIFGMMSDVPDNSTHAVCVTVVPSNQGGDGDWTTNQGMHMVQPVSGSYAEAVFYDGEDCGLSYSFTDMNRAELFEEITSTRALKMFYFGRVAGFSSDGMPVFEMDKAELWAQNRQTTEWEATPFTLTTKSNPRVIEHYQTLVDAEAAKDFSFGSSQATSASPSEITSSPYIWSVNSSFGGDLFYQFFDGGNELYLRYDSNSDGTSYAHYKLVDEGGVQMYKMTAQSGKYRRTGQPGTLFMSSNLEHRAWRQRGNLHFGLYAITDSASVSGLTQLKEKQFAGDFRENFLNHRESVTDTR